jgi:hypothetical protein
MVLMLIACVGLGWLGNRMRRIANERSVVPQILAMGGRVSYGVMEGPNFRTKLDEEMRYSPDRSLRRSFGVDHSLANWVELDSSRVTDTDLAIVASLSGLEYLTLSSTEVTDAGLPHLYQLVHLQVVDLRRTRVTDAGVQDLQRALPECRILD